MDTHEFQLRSDDAQDDAIEGYKVQESTGPSAFYKEKGLVRHMVTMDEPHVTELKKVAKRFGIKQGDVVEVMLDQLDPARMGQHFEARKARDKPTTTTKTELVKKMKDLSPVQIAAIEAILAGNG
ncbi:MAG TPA: hypothetical protein VJ673_13630 [Aromatoleum sp.]|uniref:hypothetical protein n=1 Tax=Aromatoleum sp. TaxID=2307007 RepID=UPI002B45A670|nr:hypothetical protein [Aromatoleum sp.]HJV26723.1 hypothetical protein [Aromatoleum sp.]